MFDSRFDGLVARGYVAQREASAQRATAEGLRAALKRFVPGIPREGEHSRAANGAGVVVRTDAAGCILEPNEAAAGWLKVPPDRLVGMRLLHFVARGDTRVFRAVFMGLRRDAAPRTAAVRIRPRHGRPEPVQVWVKSVARNALEWTLQPLAVAACLPPNVEPRIAGRGRPPA